MRSSRPVRSKALALAVVASASLLLAACGSSGGSDAGSGSGGATTTADSGGGSDTTTTAADTTTSATPTTAPAPAAGDLVGTWTADADSILGANLGNVGGGAGLTCSGPVDLTFQNDGTFTHKAQATCSRGSISATATIDSSGRYEADGQRIRIIAVRNDGTMEIMGRSQPMQMGWAVGTFAYTIDGDTLKVTFSNSSVGTVTQTYTRS